MSAHEEAAPVKEKFLTPGVMVMLVLMAIGFTFIAVRLIFGLGKVTNLNNQYPWGLWIAIDVASGVALAAGGFTTGLIAYVFNREQYHAVIRPALLTAMLGYTFVAIGVTLDIGRYWNIISPIFNHNGNSVLFEVAICVMCYVTVLYIEFLPIVVERFKGQVNLPGILSKLNNLLESILSIADKVLGKVMFIFIILGIVLSCLHQSSLGTLMLIAPSKVHPLWYTPILPFLFLLSAFAAGYPMVTFESIIVSKSFGREPEMEVLTPLAKFMPILMGTYLAFKLGDMFVRGTYVYLLDGTYQTNAFIVEVFFGVFLPFFLLLFSKVRKSPGWLFFASSLFVAGILMNRINVFLVAYKPPYVIESYFPAVGEFFLTIGLIATLMFLYRVIVHIFPVLGVHPEKMTRVAGGVVIFLFVFQAMGMVFHSTADAETLKNKPLPAIETSTPSIADAPKVFILNSPLINEYTDQYVPVRFMHSKHANVLKDCTICHHRVSVKEEREKNGQLVDRKGEKVTMEELVKMEKTPTKCSACHAKPFDPESLDVPGLKGAYHQLCIDCHRQAPQVSHRRGPIKYSAMGEGPQVRSMVSQAPTDCLACHAKKVPDHSKLVKLNDDAGPLDVTKECLRCHENAGHEILETSHWKWQGPSPYSVGNEDRIDLGKKGKTVNNFCVNILGNWPDCTGCHIGYGWEDDTFDFTDMSKIDCLVCHDRTDWHEFVTTEAGWPKEGLDLKLCAESVGRPERENCGSCHFFGGHGGAVKHGALTPLVGEMSYPEKSLDVHMGDGLDFKCQDCHKTRNHKIAGRSISVPVSEGNITCTYCHTETPHIDTSLLSHHLNKHTKHIACQTCHIPVYSKKKATEISWDWSVINKENANHGGHRVKKQAGQPTYFWYNGTAKHYVLGDPINENGVTEIAKPMGSREDASAKIYPFKPHKGKQVFDTVNRYLLTFQLWSGLAKHLDWDRAIKHSEPYSGLEFSGKYGFEETIMYQTVTHEVLPKEEALSCRQCHTSLAKPGKDCSMCHQAREGVDFKKLVSKGVDFENMLKEGMPVNELVGKTDYLNFKALGYDGDPIKTGGRFEKLPLHGDAGK